MEIIALLAKPLLTHRLLLALDWNQIVEGIRVLDAIISFALTVISLCTKCYIIVQGAGQQDPVYQLFKFILKSQRLLLLIIMFVPWRAFKLPLDGVFNVNKRNNVHLIDLLATISCARTLNRRILV